ncbi:MAG: lipase [Flavobacteriaceae bacterium]|nr:lipase [Flavobacteriaceae bacterium]
MKQLKQLIWLVFGASIYIVSYAADINKGQGGNTTINQRLSGEVAGDGGVSSFYRWEGKLPKAPGIMLQTEPVDTFENLPAAARVLRILYTSEDARWHTGVIPVSGQLILPGTEPPAEGWPVFAWGHGTAGVADVCAPSWTGLRERDAAYLNDWLKAGYALVLSDYQGLGGPGPHPYLYWQAEGRSVLDAAKAALAYMPEKLSNKLLLGGQSQGAGAAMGAAVLAAEYAATLNIRGMVVTGLNSVFPDGPIPVTPRNSNNMFLSLVAGGLQDNAPAIDQLVSEKGSKLLTEARRGCTESIKQVARDLRVRSMEEVINIAPEELAAWQVPVSQPPARELAFPVLIQTGMADATVTPYYQYAAARALCSAGNNVAWLTYDGLDHDSVMQGSLPDAFEFARNVMSDNSIDNHCEKLSRSVLQP